MYAEFGGNSKAVWQFILQCRHKSRNRLNKSWKYSLYIRQRNL